ncbi:hypothetical protein BN903_12 [Halorubrum sp. AJ67]|nr:hypothetical protein BN903_12 [Halorubrum sp. AJ67]
MLPLASSPAAKPPAARGAPRHAARGNVQNRTSYLPSLVSRRRSAPATDSLAGWLAAAEGGRSQARHCDGRMFPANEDHDLTRFGAYSRAWPPKNPNSPT